MAHLDLSKAADVETYLSTTPFAAKSITPLSGGYSNFAFRVHLKAPHDGRETLVMKHGKAWLPGDQDFKFDLIRQVAAILLLSEDSCS